MAPLPTNELRRRIGMLLKATHELVGELPEVLWRAPPEHPRDAYRWLTRVQERLESLSVALEWLDEHILLLKDLCADDWRQRTAAGD